MPQLTAQVTEKTRKQFVALRERWGITSKIAMGRCVRRTYNAVMSLEDDEIPADEPASAQRSIDTDVEIMKRGEIPPGYTLKEYKELAMAFEYQERGRKHAWDREKAQMVSKSQVLDMVVKVHGIFSAHLDDSLWRELEGLGADYSRVKTLMLNKRDDITDQINALLEPYRTD